MAELPEIVRARLRQRDKRGPELRSSGDVSASLGAGQHPDANLLAAFAERRLTGSERTLLLGHLADCAQCRELVALAFPSPEVQAAVAEAARPASGSPVWLRWPVWLGWDTLRWGVLAASVGVVLIGGFRAGVLRWPASQKSAPTISKSPADENKQPSILRAANDSSSSVRGAPSSLGERAERDGLESGNAPAKPAEPPRTPAQDRAGFKAKLKKQETASAPGARRAKGVPQAGEAPTRGSLDIAQVPPAKNAEGYSKERDESHRASQASAAQSQALASGGFATPSDSLQAEKANPVQQQSSLELQTAEVQDEAVSKEKIGPASKASEVERRRLSAMAQALAPPSPPPTGSSGVGAARALRFDQVGELAKDKRLLTAQWSIASVVGPYAGDSSPAIGRVERSVDGGKTWQELHVNDRVSFRAVAANGPEVWAGGSGGALYHSTDVGQHWTRVLVGLDQGVVTETVVSIDVGGSRNVRVATDAHETWVTADGGQHWENR